jgi:hypothetical protein
MNEELEAKFEVTGHAHRVTNVLVNVDGTQAASEAYVSALIWDAREGGTLDAMTVVGRYLDGFAHVDGRWVIRHRRFLFEALFPHAGPDGPRSNAIGESIAAWDGFQQAARRDVSDPSYSWNMLAGLR